MPCHIWGNLYALLISLYPELHRVDTFKTVQDLLVVEKRFVSLHLGSVANEVVVNIFGGFGHVYFFFVVGVASQEVWESTAVVEVGVGDDDHRDLFRVNAVKEWQTVGVLLVYH
jgi:hypothetical protein